MQDITTLIFDFDGTLATCPYDFAQMRVSVLSAAVDFGIDVTALRDDGLLETVAAGVEWLGGQHPQAAAFRDEAMRRLSDLEYEAAEYTFLLPGIMDALDRLQAAGYTLGVVTRNSAAAVRRILGATPLPLGVLLSRDDVPHPKPHPDHVYRALHQLDCAPDTALMVGDHPTDIAMGKLAGMRTVGVLTGQTDAEGLRTAVPDLLLPSVVELAGVLLGQQSASRDG